MKKIINQILIYLIQGGKNMKIDGSTKLIKKEEMKEENLFYPGLITIVMPVIIVSLIFLLDSGTGKEAVKLSFEYALNLILAVGVFLAFTSGGFKIRTSLLFSIIIICLVITNIFLGSREILLIAFGGVCLFSLFGLAYFLKKMSTNGNKLYFFVFLIFVLCLALCILTAWVLGHSVFPSFEGISFPLG